ncbi:recombinase family protein [Tissierella sp. MB52-C2]|uniref:recombinase family protein n=1 Tax=Tissierella sp. MB52-C2 TaxID=3070999 RepID=UPI00280B0F66|nr:recombinase family protein [Tissierella sp. MB52-C2]WMM26713.1 recombinase family protein [Tissierella sp. MB52-C2]
MKERQMKIIPGAPLAAIYTRKSRATEMGESIENQIARCIALCDYKGWGYIVYVDYDYSGKDTDRPDFFEMMKKVRNNEFDYVVVYHIYRFARNMKDFTILMDEFQELEVGFTSISQDFDTSTPTGRAAMYMTAVFGQLGREDTAMQVRDNMIYLAEKGRWNGGPVPYGFDTYSELVEYRDGEGNKKITYLIENEGESAFIKKFAEWYLETNGSIRGNVTKANELGYRTKRGAYWNSSQMSRILQNPLYCIADEDSYEYFKDNFTGIFSDKARKKENWNGTHGLMFYNRRKPYKKTSRLRDETEWILSIGEHKGFIPGETFAKIQHKLSKNKSQPPRTGQSIRSPLVGLVRCGRCNSAMSIFGSHKTSDKSKGYYHYFRCLTREIKSKILCDNSNVRADILEDLVLSNIFALIDNENSLKSILEATNNDIEDKRTPLMSKANKLKSDLSNIDSEINNLVDALSKNILPELMIKRKYKDLENKKIEVRNELEKINIELSNNYYEDKFDIDTVKKYIKNLKHNYKDLSFEQKKELLNSIVKEVSMDRNKVKLTLYFLPGKSLQEYNDLALCSHMDKDLGWR